MTFSEFRAAFPDWRQDIVELVSDETTVVARFGCTGTPEVPGKAWHPPAGG